MNLANYEIIQTMYDELKREREAKLFSLEENKNRIEEIDAYLNNLLNKEESDLQVFLPRKVENIYHDVIEQNKHEREKLLYEIDEIEKQILLEESRMEQLKKVLSDSSMLHVKQLSILDAQEKERQRIARDLHDTSLQNLTHLVHKVELSSLYIDEDSVQAKLELATVAKGIRRVIEEIRNSIFELRPMSVDDIGLCETIEKLLDVINHDRQFCIVTDIDQISFDRDNQSAHVLFISIYRIIQECVQNSVKHSNGSEITVKLKEKENEYWINIRDNGKGFDLEEASKKDMHFGLSVIRERVLFLGGTINIDTENGTSIEVIIPKTMTSAKKFLFAE